MDEIWKDIPGYKGYYQASNMGQIRSVERKVGNNHTYPCKIRKQNKHRSGYRQVSLNKNCNKDMRYVHLLVLLAFCGPPPRGLECNHINGDKADNRLDNLEYCTRSANHLHAWKVLGKKKYFGEKHWLSKLTNKDVRYIRKAWATGNFTQRYLAKKLHVSASCVQQVLNGDHWSHLK